MAAQLIFSTNQQWTTLSLISTKLDSEDIYRSIAIHFCSNILPQHPHWYELLRSLGAVKGMPFYCIKDQTFEGSDMIRMPAESPTAAQIAKVVAERKKHIDDLLAESAQLEQNADEGAEQFTARINKLKKDHETLLNSIDTQVTSFMDVQTAKDVQRRKEEAVKSLEKINRDADEKKRMLEEKSKLLEKRMEEERAKENDVLRYREAEKTRRIVALQAAEKDFEEAQQNLQMATLEDSNFAAFTPSLNPPPPSTSLIKPIPSDIIDISDDDNNVGEPISTTQALQMIQDARDRPGYQFLAAMMKELDTLGAQMLDDALADGALNGAIADSVTEFRLSRMAIRKTESSNLTVKRKGLYILYL